MASRFHEIRRVVSNLGVFDFATDNHRMRLASVHPGASVEQDEVIEHVRGHLARYKAPRRVIVVDTIGRSPAGKVDYKGLQKLARDRAGV